ncbi:MAG TPA: hypothetical protein VFG12_02825, partial [Rhodopila sp.]|nr:hypothetical protein [Rhodopila sp.]
MTLDVHDCVLSGPAITEPFLHDGLSLAALLPKGIELGWDKVRGSLRGGSAQRVHLHVTTNLARAFGYTKLLRQEPVPTRDGREDGGWLLHAPCGTSLRAWSVASDIEL